MIFKLLCTSHTDKQLALKVKYEPLLLFLPLRGGLSANCSLFTQQIIQHWRLPLRGGAERNNVKRGGGVLFHLNRCVTPVISAPRASTPLKAIPFALQAFRGKIPCPPLHSRAPHPDFSKNPTRGPRYMPLPATSPRYLQGARLHTPRYRPESPLKSCWRWRRRPPRGGKE